MSDPFGDDLVAALQSLRAFARTFHRDHARADDLVQETVAKALAKRDQFRPDTNLRAWLFTILRNTYLSEKRKRRREVEDVDGSMVGGLVSKPCQDGHMALSDLKDALQQLGEDQREALILVGAAGFSYEEAGKICGVAPGTVKSRVSRGRSRLAVLMAEGSGSIAPTDELVKAAAGEGLDRA
ncbi:MAG: sigma-70 family RNA polymerase sigma factor, partial [Pseudomonadota bacterium]